MHQRCAAPSKKRHKLTMRLHCLQHLIQPPQQPSAIIAIDGRATKCICSRCDSRIRTRVNCTRKMLSSSCRFWFYQNIARVPSLITKAQTPLHGHGLRTCCTTPPTDELTTILQQICHIAMPQPSISTCQDVGMWQIFVRWW